MLSACRIDIIWKGLTHVSTGAAQGSVLGAGRAGAREEH
eukprot:COSAG05_NODE_11165_length_527_cov_0.857477_1_plen_38_part_01